MRYSQSMNLASKTSGVLVIDPDSRAIGRVIGFVPSKLKIEAFFVDYRGGEKREQTFITVEDIKVGKNSQLCAIGGFSSDLLEVMNLNVERRTDTQMVSASIYNPHDRTVIVTFSFDEHDVLMLPLGVSHADKQDFSAPYLESVPWQGEGAFVAWSQVGGSVVKLVLDRKFSIERDVIAVTKQKFIPGKDEKGRPRFEAGVNLEELRRDAASGEILFKNATIEPAGRLTVLVRNTSALGGMLSYHLAFVIGETRSL